MTHKLKQWRKANKITAEALAERVNRLPRQIYRWEDGTCRPEPEIIAQLAEITGGQVQFSDWYSPRPPSPTEPAREIAE